MSLTSEPFTPVRRRVSFAGLVLIGSMMLPLFFPHQLSSDGTEALLSAIQASLRAEALSCRQSIALLDQARSAEACEKSRKQPAQLQHLDAVFHL